MTFTPNIPADGETLGNSKLEVRNNFTNYNNVLSVNHNAPNSTGQGKHKFVEMPVQVAGPANLPLAQEGGLITQTAIGASELYYARDAVNTYYQMTGPVFTGKGALTMGGTTMLFGGIIFKWGRADALSGTKLFATECGSAFPNNCFNITAIRSNGLGFSIDTITNTGFNFTRFTPGQPAGTFDFVAIGN